MAISDDWDATSVVKVDGGAFSVSIMGKIRHKRGNFMLTAEEFHKALAPFKNKHDEPMSEYDPKNKVVTLREPANIDEEMARHLRDGAVKQNGRLEYAHIFGGIPDGPDSES